MLSFNTPRLATIRPAQYQKINQISLLILICSAALAPAWLNIVAIAGYSIMNWLTFKQLCISIIQSVLERLPSRQPEPPTPRLTWRERQDLLEEQARTPRPSTGNTHRYFGDGLYGRNGTIGKPGRHGKRIDRQFRRG